MDFENDKPIYLQVVEDITSRIIAGQIEPGSKLPSSRELAVEYTINPNTASRVYAELERRGIAFTRRGIGTFVAEGDVDDLRRERIEKVAAEFVESMRGMGLSDQEIIALVEEFIRDN